MSEWARKLAEEKKEQLRLQQLKEEKELNNQRLVAANSNKMWIQVRQAAEKYAKELSAEMGIKDYMTVAGAENQNQFYFQIGSSKSLVTYEPSTFTITNQIEKYKLCVLPERNDVVMWLSGGPPSAYTSEEVGRWEAERAFRRLK